MATAVTPVRSRVGWTRSRAWATRYAWLVVGYTVLVIVWGAAVRATGSGAGCGNHWPLCNGQVIPVSPGVHTLIEFIHRMMTGGSTLLVIGLLVWTFRSTVRGQRARVAAVLSGVLLLNEALLGALLVKLGYVTTNQSAGRVVMLSIHLSNTLVLLAALTMTAVLLGTGSFRRRRRAGSLESQPALVTAGLLSTLLVGVSGSLAALGDTLFPSPSLKAALAADLSANAPALIRIRWVHPASALLATVFIGWLLLRQWRSPETASAARWVAGLLVLQFVLGLADVLLLAPVPLQLLHLGGADLLWIALVTLSAKSLSARSLATSSPPQTAAAA